MPGYALPASSKLDPGIRPLILTTGEDKNLLFRCAGWMGVHAPILLPPIVMNDKNKKKIMKDIGPTTKRTSGVPDRRYGAEGAFPRQTSA